MFRRRRSMGRFLGKQREPTIWVRQIISQVATNCLATTVPITLATPTDLPGVVGTDVRYTLMRMLFRYTAAYQLTTAAAGVVGDLFQINMGIFFGSATESLSPVIGGSTTDDWLWLYNTIVGSTVAGANLVTVIAPAVGALLRNTQNEAGLIDIKAKRKVDADEAIRFTTRIDGTELLGSGHNLTAATFTTKFLVSTLWKRTMR